MILVTEHNAEVNARFVVLRGSNHAPPLLLANIGRGWCRPTGSLCPQWSRNERDDRDMTPTECQAWIQTGLALSPFCGHIMDTSLEWAVAWSLVGEWTTRALFLPPKGEWPRQGHPKALISPYDQRSELVQGIRSFLACPPRGGLSPGSPW